MTKTSNIFHLILSTLDVPWSDMTLYCVEPDNAITRVEDYSNSELTKLSHTSPSRASYRASLWDICTKITAIHRGCTIYRCRSTGMKLSYKRNMIYIYILHLGNCEKYFSCVINATYLCFIAPVPFDVKYMNIRNYHLNDICSRLDIEGPIS